MNQQQPLLHLRQTLNKSKAANHRALLVLSGARNECWTLLEQLLRNSGLSTFLSYQPPDTCPVKCHALKRATDLLGSNNDCVIFDAWGGFDPDAFGIISGSINGGGLAVLISPPLNQWSDYADPENKRLAVHPLEASDVSGFYLKRIARIIASDLPPAGANNDIEYRLLVSTSTAVAALQPLPNHEQIDLISAIEQLIIGSSTHSPMLVTADRGRGKSTALGLAAAKLLKAGMVSKVIVTAPGKQSLHSFFQHAQSALKGSTTALPVFIATDILLKERPKACLLIIDEAAAIPLPLLLKLIQAYPRCILSSTLHGYEGSGRGFALRLRSLLDIHYPAWQEKQLTCPARFAMNDPLEFFTAKLLMLDSADATIAVKTVTDKKQYELKELSAASLIQNEKKLNELFALLVQAHYQTKPLDLKHLLDGPNLRIFALTHESTIVAAVLLATEQITGDSPLQDAIIHGERRPRGHLLSQQLAYQNLEKEYLNLKIARIVRIAVVPQLQSQFLGSLLLEKLNKHCTSDGFDAIGASFGATKELLNFWNKNHYQTLHLGHRENASSASYSTVVFRGISQHAKLIFSQSLDNFLCSLNFRNNKTQTRTLINWILGQTNGSTPSANPIFTKAVVLSYAYRHRDFESSHAELNRYLLDINLSNTPLTKIQQQALTSIVLQCSSWDKVSKTLKLQGRKDCEHLLRTAFRIIQEHT